MTRVTPGEKHAVILGSGFSRAVSDAMPTLSELLDLVLSDLWLMERKRVNRDDLDNKFGGNLEQWMSFLAVAQPWLSDAQNLANRSLFESVRESLARCIADAEDRAVTSPPPEWLIRLVWTWCEAEVPVVTFNYDTLIERTIAHLGRVQTFADVYAAPLEERIAAGSGRFLSASEPSGPVLDLYKLHGSTNWAFGGLDSPPNDRIVLTNSLLNWAPSRVDDHKPAGRNRWKFADLTSLIIPPTLSKGPYFSNLALRSQWRWAADALNRATHLTVMGYSFPVGDLVARQWVATSFMGYQMNIVDSAEHRPKEIRDTLAGAKSGIDVGGPKAVKDYVDQNCGPLVRWNLRERDASGDLAVELWVNGVDLVASIPEAERPWGQDYWEAQKWVHQRVAAAAGVEDIVDRAVSVGGMSGGYDHRFVVLPRGSKVSLD